MGQLSKILRNVQGPALSFWCPGCNEAHVIDVGPSGWKWNGDAERPVFSPSILVQGHRLTRNAEGKWVGGWERDAAGNLIPERCHSYVGSADGSTPGRIQFLGDCTHDLKGQTVNLPEWPARP